MRTLFRLPGGRSDRSSTYRSRSSAALVLGTIAALIVSVGNTFVVAHAAGATTSTNLTVSPPSPAAYGTAVTLTATVQTSPVATTPPPTGTVEFDDPNLSPIGTCTAQTLTNTGPGATFSTATCTISNLALGSGHSFIAHYSGDTLNGASDSNTVPYTILTATTTTVSGSPSTSSTGQGVTFTATVDITPSQGSGGAVPGGTVDFVDTTTGNTPLCSTVGLTGTGPWSATCNHTFAAAALPGDTITATYSGDVGTAGSSGTTTQVVKNATTTTLNSGTSVTGQLATLSGTVTGAGSPGGNVNITEGVTPICTGALSAGAFSCTAAFATTGTHTLTATYAGDANNASSSGTGTQTVNKADTTTGLSASTLTPSVGDQVTYTATVAVVGPGAGAPTGNINFQEGATLIGTCSPNPAVLPGQDACSITYPNVGTHTPIAAFYVGDTNFNGSDSSGNPLTVTVSAAGTSTSLSGPAVTTPTTPTTLTATVTRTSGGGTPDGGVTFTDTTTSTTLCTNIALTGSGPWTATCSASFAITGSHALTAQYTSATGNYTTSTGNFTEKVQYATSTLLVTSTGSPYFGQSVTFTANVTASSGTPGGNVQFNVDGSPFGSPVALSGGAAQLTTATLSVGPHSVTADYAGDGTAYQPSTSNTANENVAKATTSVGVATSGDVVVGQNVTYTATITITNGAGTPGGNVTFFDGVNPIGTCNAQPVSGGTTATCVTSYMTTAGSPHSIKAQYNGDSSFAASAVSAPLTENVTAAPTSMTVGSSAPTTGMGTSVQYTATVDTLSPGSGAATGSVSFTDNGSPIGSCALSPAGNSASCAITSPVYSTSGTHNIVASYTTDGNYASVDNSGSPYVETVSQGSVSVSISPSPGASVTGQSVTFTITVTPIAPATAPPTGTVTINDGGSPIAGCTAVPVSTGTCTTTFTATGGGHVLTTDYSGDANYVSQTATPQMTYTVTASPTTTTITSVSPASGAAVTGQAVTINATVAPSGSGGGTIDNGSVAFFDAYNGGSATLIAGCNAVPAAGGSVSCTIPAGTILAGNHSFTATYSGDTAYQGSSTLAGTGYLVNPANTQTVVTGPTTGVTGQSLTFTATVSPTGSGGGTPAGTAAFFVDGSPASCGPQTLSGGAATCSVAIMSSGPHSITATYTDTAVPQQYNTSNSAGYGVTISQATTTTTLTASPLSGAGVTGQPVTLTATVTASGLGSGTPGGTVTFQDGATVLCSGASLTAGVATCNVPNGFDAASSPHALTASYSGDPNYQASSGNLSYSVNKAGTTTAVTAQSGTQPKPGQSFTVSATVTANSPSTDVPALTGTVTFSVNGGAGCAAAVNGAGVASCSVTEANAGQYTITASYSGDSNYLTSADTTGQKYNVATGTVTIGISPTNPTTTAGSSVAFTVTIAPVAPATTAPTGTVTFTDSNGAISTIPASCTPASLSATSPYQATCTIDFTASGSDTVTATYSGDANYAGNSTSTTVTVNPAATSVTVTDNPVGSSVVGQNVTYTATIAYPAKGKKPTGNVTFFDGGTTIGTCSAQTVGAAVTATCTLKYTTTTGSPHSITAQYNGDANYSQSPVSAAILHTVNPANTSTALAENPNTGAKTGQPVTLTATVTDASAGSSQTPAGTVDFTDGTTTLCGGVALNGSGVATCSVPNGFTAGSHNLTAAFNANSDWNGSSAGVAYTVGTDATTTTITAQGGPILPGQSFTIVATGTANSPGTGVPAPTGTVAFSIGGNPVAGCGSQPLVAGVTNTAQCTTSLANAGNYSLTAVFTSGDTNYGGSTSAPVTYTVSKGSTTTVISATTTTPIVGTTVDFTATVTENAPAATTPTGTVSYSDSLGYITGAACQNITFSTPCTVFFPNTTPDTVTVTYNPDANYNTSSDNVTINPVKADTTVTLTDSPAGSSSVGVAVTYTAVVSVPAGADAPTGTVTFTDGGTTIATCAAQLVDTSATATCTVTYPTVVGSPHAIVATYNGDGNYNGSSNSLSHTVVAGDTTTAVVTSVSPAVVGQPVTFTATVTAVLPAIGVPTGTVDFIDSTTLTTLCGGVTVDATGNATCTATWMAPTAGDTITANFIPSADASWNASSGTTTQVVDQADTITTLASQIAPGGSGTTPWTAPSKPQFGCGDPGTDGAGATGTVVSAVFGQPVVFTATVAPEAPGAGQPTGTVDFSVGGTLLQTCSVNATTGEAVMWSTTGIPAGTSNITADYSGDSSFHASGDADEDTVDALGVADEAPGTDPADNATSNAVQLTLGQATTMTIINVSPNPGVDGQPVTITAVVIYPNADSGTPTDGTVTFFDGTTILGTAPVDSTGTAVLSLTLALGDHTLSATYSGGQSGLPASCSVGDPTQTCWTMESVDALAAVPTTGAGGGYTVGGIMLLMLGTLLVLRARPRRRWHER